VSETLLIEIPDALVATIAARAAELVATRPVFLSKGALAAHYGVSQRTIRTWREHGLPGVRVGREVMYPLDECDRWIEGHG
jgi:hypothetical protein